MSDAKLIEENLIKIYTGLLEINQRMLKTHLQVKESLSSIKYFSSEEEKMSIEKSIKNIEARIVQTKEDILGYAHMLLQAQGKNWFSRESQEYLNQFRDEPLPLPL